MAYQPNPFVDPNHRGFELPAGCKDLHDLLVKMGRGELRVPSRVLAGRIGTIRTYVAPLYEAKSQRVALVIMNSERGALLIISYREGRFKLILLLHKGSAFLEQAIIELFGEAALATSSRTDDELKTVHIPLPEKSPHRELLEQTALNCPVHKSLPVEINRPTKFFWEG